MHMNEHEVIQAYEEALNETYEPCRIGQLEYEPATVLKRVDPVAYREGLLDYADSLAQDGMLPDDWETWTF